MEKKTLFQRLGNLIRETIFVPLGNAYRNSKFQKIVDTVFGSIGVGLSYLFFPITLLYRKWYKKLRFDQQKVVVSILFLSPVIFGFLVFYLYPFIMSFIYSFSSFAILPGKPLQVYFGQRLQGTEYVRDLWFNYRYAFRVDAAFVDTLLTTIQSTVLNLVVITIFSLLMAVLLNGEFKGRAAVRAIFFLPVIFNSQAVDVAMAGVESVDAVLQQMTSGQLSALFNMQGFLSGIGIPSTWIATLGGITSAIYATISYSGVQILIFLAAIQSVPRHLYEAAKIEGATSYEMFWKITLPMVSPMIITVVVFTIIDSFLRSEINTVIQSYFKQNNFGVYSAMSWIYIIVSLVIVVAAVGLLSLVTFYHDDRK